MKYRREIDGLRAVAVIPVVLFHAGFTGFSGGFVGVDVFFVISGYLITSVIVEEKHSGKFTLRGFYERRARRILPALFIVVALCVPFAWMWMWRSEAKEFADSVIAVATFVSNILFWQERGYFDPAGELKPLLHTWSLAVEEQYYLLFPIVLSLLLRLGKRVTLAAIVVCGVGSLLLASYMTVSGPTAAFFLLPTRAWEILIGATLALTLGSRGFDEEKPSVLEETLPVIGLVLIVASVWFLDNTTPFPGLWALAPTIGAALVITFASDHSLVGRMLGSRLLVGVGLISYSAYLWHQPILAFARLRAVSEPPTWVITTLCLAVIPLAVLSWRFVEVPMRDRSRFSRRQIFAFALVGSACLIGLGILTRNTPTLARQLPPNVEWADIGAKLETIGDVCTLEATPGYPGVETCLFGDIASTHLAVLYGDSHARALSSELDGAFKTAHIKGVKLEASGCLTVPTLVESRAAYPSDIQACRRSYASSLAYMRDSATDIVVASRWTFFMYPIPREVDELTFDNQEGGTERNAFQETLALDANGALNTGAAAKRAALEGFIEGLTALKKHLIIVGPVPEVGWDIAKLNWSYYHDEHELLPEISTRYDLYRSRNHFVLDVFDEFANDPDVHFVWPDRIFCNTFIKDRCAAQFDTVPLYYDDDHLSDKGAHLVVRDIMGVIAQ